MRKLLKVMILLILIISLASCSKTSVVRDAMLNGREQTTVGDAFDGCFAKTKWKSGVTPNKTRLVSFSGTVVNDIILTGYLGDPFLYIPQNSIFNADFIVNKNDTFEINDFQFEIRVLPNILANYNAFEPQSEKNLLLRVGIQVDDGFRTHMSEDGIIKILLDYIYANPLSIKEKNKILKEFENKINQKKATSTEEQKESPNTLTEEDSIDEPNPITTNMIYKISASSSLKNYDPELAFDGDNSTAWVEGVKGNGIGQWIKFEFTESLNLNEIKIVPGYDKYKENVGDLWVLNNQLKEISLTFSDGSTQDFSIQEGNRFQKLSLKPVNTKSVTITVKAVYKGSKWDDTAISEIYFYNKK